MVRIITLECQVRLYLQTNFSFVFQKLKYNQTFQKQTTTTIFIKLHDKNKQKNKNE